MCLRVHASVYTVEIQNGARAGGEPVAHFTMSAVARPPTQGWAVAVTSGQDLSLRTSCLSERPGVVAAGIASPSLLPLRIRPGAGGPSHWLWSGAWGLEAAESGGWAGGHVDAIRRWVFQTLPGRLGLSTRL